MALKQQHLVITEEEYELPYSKGLMASEITTTGLAPARAFPVAEVIENRLHGKAVAVQRVGTVNEEEAHRSHFIGRAREAVQHRAPAVPSSSLDAALSQVIDLVRAQAFEAVPSVLSQPSETTNRQTRVGAGSGGEL